MRYFFIWKYTEGLDLLAQKIGSEIRTGQLFKNSRRTHARDTLIVFLLKQNYHCLFKCPGFDMCYTIKVTVCCFQLIYQHFVSGYRDVPRKEAV